MKRSLIVAALIPTLLLEIAWPALAAAKVGPQTPADPQSARPPGQELADELFASRAVADGLPRGTRPRRAEPGDGLPRGTRPRRFVYDAPNGIKIVVDGHASGAADLVARAKLTAPNGESMTFDFADGGRFGPSVLLDGEILVGYRLSRSGQVTSVTFDDGVRTVRSPRGGRSHTESHAAYLALANALAERHSPEFLREIDVALQAMHRDQGVPAQMRQWIECALAVTGYVVSIWGLLAGCAVAGVPTLGASCVFAILAHEAAVASAILSCFP